MDVCAGIGCCKENVIGGTCSCRKTSLAALLEDEELRIPSPVNRFQTTCFLYMVQISVVK